MGLHQPRAQHIHVIDLPRIASLLQSIVQLDGVTLALDHGAHDHIRVGRTGTGRQVLNDLVLDLGSGTRIGVHQQGLELVLQTQTLIRRGATPGRADGGCRHAHEVHVRHDLGIDHGRDLAQVTRLDGLVGLDRGHHLVGDRLNERLGRLGRYRCGRLGRCRLRTRLGRPQGRHGHEGRTHNTNKKPTGVRHKGSFLRS